MGVSRDVAGWGERGGIRDKMRRLRDKLVHGNEQLELDFQHTEAFLITVSLNISIRPNLKITIFYLK